MTVHTPFEPFDVRSIAVIPRSTAEAQIASRCCAVPFGPDRILCRCLGRFKMFLDPSDVGFAPHIMLDGFWEFWITQFKVRTVKSGMTVMDIGANYGYYSLLMSELVGPDGKCITVEANPAVAEPLRLSLSINGFSERAPVHNIALSDCSGEVRFFIPQNEPKNGCIVSTDFQSDAGELMALPCTTVDELAKDLVRLDFIKIDAEGAEADIIEGMSETLNRLKPALLVEFNAARGYDAGALLRKFEDYAGKLQFVDVDGWAKEISRARLLSENFGNDWMVFVDPR